MKLAAAKDLTIAIDENKQTKILTNRQGKKDIPRKL